MRLLSSGPNRISLVVPLKGDHIRIVVEELRRQYSAGELNFGVGIVVSGERSAVAIAGIRYDKTNEAEARREFVMGRRMVEALGSLGCGDGRPHLEFMDIAADQHSFNDHAYRRFMAQLKDAIDPNGILSPGSHGVWPSTHNRDSAE